MFLACLIALTSSAIWPLIGNSIALDTWRARSSIADVTEAFPNGYFSGQVTLQGVYTGEWSAPPASAPQSGQIDLGLIDLAVSLTSNEQGTRGSIDLRNSLVFSSTEGSIALASQMVNGVSQIVSSGYSTNMNDALAIHGESIRSARIATRQLALVPDPAQKDSGVFDGTYRETIWGYGPSPVTVFGRFSLRRGEAPRVDPPNPPSTRRLFLPVVRR